MSVVIRNNWPVFLVFILAFLSALYSVISLGDFLYTFNIPEERVDFWLAIGCVVGKLMMESTTFSLGGAYSYAGFILLACGGYALYIKNPLLRWIPVFIGVFAIITMLTLLYLVFKFVA